MTHSSRRTRRALADAWIEQAFCQSGAPLPPVRIQRTGGRAYRGVRTEVP